MQCSVCHRGQRELGHSLKTCAICQQPIYCSKHCQKKDWRRHRKEHSETFSIQVAGALSGQTLVVEGCVSTTPIAQLRRQLAEYIGIEYFQLYLLFGSQELLNGASLGGAGVAGGSRLSWILTQEDEGPPPLTESSDDESPPIPSTRLRVVADVM